MTEIWIKVGNDNCTGKAILEVSNYGRVKRKNGSIEYSKYEQTIRTKNGRLKIHRILADMFIPKTQEDVDLGRVFIDHITHNPVGMNINDVRNLRWCTHKENMGYDEVRINKSKANKGKIFSEFGKKFKEHFGISKQDNPRLYDTEYKWYYTHNKKCRWEV